MITYDTGGIYFFLNLFRLYGSVFPKAMVISIPNAFVCAGFVLFIHDMDMIAAFKDQDYIMNNNAIWGGFSFLVGFLVVFRTSQAYHRFWEGCTQMHKMGAEWFDACSSLMAFCKHSDADKAEILRFQNLLIRLFSMLHAAALGEIEDCGSSYNYMEVQAFNMELIDAESVDSEALAAIRNCDAKVELIFQWIQQLVVENIKTGVLSIPPPILSRSFQEIATGMVHFHEAMKISNVPFPFPYAQTCDCLLMFHWFLVPFISSQWVTKAWWAGIFSFIQVFTFWTLNLIAVELENPFGTDPNDIDGATMQLEMNNHLRLLIRPETFKTPGLSKSAAQDIKTLTLKAYIPDLPEDGFPQELYHEQPTHSSHEMPIEPQSTFHKIWKTMEFSEEAVRRYSRVNMSNFRSSTVHKTASVSMTGSMAGSMFISENTDKSNEDSSKNSQGWDQESPKGVRDVKGVQRLVSPDMHEAHGPIVRQDNATAGGRDLLQQGMWEPYPDSLNGATQYQTPTNIRNHQGALGNEENSLQIEMRLGEIFDQLDSGFDPAQSPEAEGRWEETPESPRGQLTAIGDMHADTPEWEGNWQDTQENPRGDFVAVPSEIHMTQPPAEPSSESQSGLQTCSSVDSDAILRPAVQPAPILMLKPALL